MYFPIPGHPLVYENILLSCPPPVLHNTWGGHDSRKFLVSCPPPLYWVIQGGDMIVKIFLVSCPPHVLANTGGGHEIDLFLLISGTLSFQALIKLITMWTLCVWLGHIGKYHLHSSKLGFNTDLEPAALGPYWTPISKNEDGISQYVRARRTVFTLLSI